MSLNALMEALAQRNIKLSSKAGELSVSAAKGALTAELTAQLKQHKSAIIALLEQSYAESTVSQEAFEIKPDRENAGQPFPFSDLQVAFYMASDPYMEYHVQPHYYNEKNMAEFDIARYQTALNKALLRHASEIVLICGDRQLQAIPDFAPLEFRINDFTVMSPEKAGQELLRVRQRLMRQEIPLDRWPWIDIEISLWMDNGVRKARIHSNQNNFYMDGLGSSVLQKEIDDFYDDPALELPPLQLTLRDAILGLQTLSESAAGERAQRYWLERLPELPDPPPLPQVYGMNRKCRSRLQRRENVLSAELWNKLKENASHYGLTPSSTVITAYAEILSAWSGSRHFILSNMVTRRLPLHEDIFRILGNFASLYPLEVDLRGDGSFVDRTRRLQQQILRDSDHKQWGGMQVMQAFNRLKGEFGTVPCPFVVGSGLFMGGSKKADFSCLETSQTIMDHQFWELTDGSYYYVWDLLEEFFPAGMIDSMWHAFDKLLRTLATDRDYWQRRLLDLAPQADAGPVVAEDAMPVPRGLLHRGLAAACRAAAGKPVLQTPAGDLSYRELETTSDAVAVQLSRLQVRPNELVAIMMNRGAPLVAAAVGILKAGAAYVPVDPGLPAERVQYLLDNTQARVVLTQKAYQAAVRQAKGDITVIVVDDLETGAGAGFRQAPVEPDDLAYVIYTSGSTGQPKGVMIDHRAALNTVVDINRRFGIGASDKVFGVSSFSFDLSVYDVFGVFEAGATLVYPDPAAAYNPAHWLEVMKSREVTVWNSAPPLMSLLAETALRQKAVLPALRVVMLSGDWIPVDLPAAIRQFAPNARIISLGGATEAAIWSIYFPIDRVDAAWVSIPYGKPLANQGWQIRDSLGRRAPLWTVGELFITGIGLAKGYWRDEEKTNRSFITDTVTGERLYRTGDMGRYLPDGNIEFMGRIDAQVKIQGHRIELGEIEAAMHESPLVGDAVVLAQPVKAEAGATRPRREKQLIAYIVPADRALAKEGADTAEIIRALQTFLKEKLPAYMVPVGWAFLDSLPITRNGKLDRKALEKVAYTGADKTASNKGAITAPRSETEKQLAGIWQRVLNRPSVGINEDFFEIGGKSFDAVRCVALVQEHFGIVLSLGDIWQERTIESLAVRIEGGQHTDSTRRLIPLKTAGTGAPCFFVHPGGGQIIGYYPLAERLARPSYAFLAVAGDIDSGGMQSIEIIAARYVRLLRQQGPGPYNLAGWSSGGCIAFETAAQLEAAGERVERVIMIDAPAPLQHEPIDHVEMLKGFFEDLGLELPVGKIDGLHPASDTQSEFERIVTLFNRDAAQPVQLEAGQLYPIYRVFKACVDAVRNYRTSKKIAAEIMVARAADGAVTEFAGHPHGRRADWGWSLFSTGGVSCAILRGTHHTLLRMPQVEALAELINTPEKAAPFSMAAGKTDSTKTGSGIGA